MKILNKQKTTIEIKPKKIESKVSPSFVKDYKPEPCKGCGNKKN